MKSKILFFLLVMLLHTVISVRAQRPVYLKPKSNELIPFGKKLPPPVLNPIDKIIEKSYNKKMMDLPYTTFDKVSRQFIATIPGQKTAPNLPPRSYSTNSTGQTAAKPIKPSSGFHLTKDINTHTQPGSSYPNNYNDYRADFHSSFAILNNVSYFNATDGIHGFELWRSDGTTAGTYMVKDIISGGAGSGPYWITAANGKLYFNAYTDANGWEPWVSDGTEGGTQMLVDINTGASSSDPSQFVAINSTVFFVANGYYYGSAIWKTDGTQDGTSVVYNLGAAEFADRITEATAANGLLFFSANTQTYGRELWRSDGTEAGTFMVKDIGPDQGDYYSPLQLTEYNNKLYFSGDDGFGRKLWVSDGTLDGTTNVSGNNDIIVQTDFLDYNFNYPFPVLNNVLYLGAYSYNDGHGLYKYDASSADGLVLVKDFTPSTDPDYIVPTDLVKAGNTLYFKVINSIGGYHDDLWSSNGATENTQIVKTFEPGHITNNYYDSYGTLYFLEDDPTYGGELWKSNGTEAGTNLVKDIFPGSRGSWPAFITPYNGKVIFNSTNAQYGTELWITDGTDIGTVLVKDINSINATNTDGSEAGFFYKGLCATGNGVVFNAFTPTIGAELYKSDGTAAGTVLLNNIDTGNEDKYYSYPNSFIFKNNVTYFIGDNPIGTALYKTNGTTAGLQRITAYINRDVFYVINFNVTDNGLAFYTLGNRFTSALELWRSDGTEAGTYMLTPNLSYYYNNYLVTIVNMVFFIAGDDVHGYELWKSDGTIAGTKMVKDINPGSNGSDPYSLFVYKNNVYFGAYDGHSIDFHKSLWKSDGSEKGTIKLKNIEPTTYFSYFNPEPQHVFCVSNSALYFTAIDFNTYGNELWKTNGTESGTKLVKDINPFNSSLPNNLTNVNGTLYFTANDGVHGTELWSTTGTSNSTKMVKEITPDYNLDNLRNLCNAGGKLYFLNDVTYPNTLWSSDGTANNTNQVIDPGLNGLFNITNLTPAGNKLFFGAYSDIYGTELYEGDAGATNPTFASINSANRIAPIVELNSEKFDAILYPNPTHSTSSLQIKGNAKNVGVTITDMSGKIIWQTKENNHSQINLPVEKLATGAYIITVKSGIDKKTLKFVKE